MTTADAAQAAEGTGNGLRASPTVSEPGTGDPAKLRHVLGAPELSWLVDRIRIRLERGEPVDGTVTLVGATPEQRKAAARLLGHRLGRGTSLSIPLPEVDAALRRAGVTSGLRGAVETLAGRPVRNPQAERAAEIHRFHEALDVARHSRLNAAEWYSAWLDEITKDSSLIRLVRQGQDHLLAQATAVLERLPEGAGESPVLLHALAETVTGDAAALNATPLATLVLRALALREAVSVPAGREAERALWTAAGVVTDDLTSQVLVLNVRAGGDKLGEWLTEAAEAGEPFRVTLHQLSVMSILPLAIHLYVCENASVVQAAASQLGAASAPLVCTEGEPSVACRRLLQTALATGTRIHWHADMDWSGLRQTTAAISRMGATPWLMSADDYTAAASVSCEPLKGTPVDSPWDPRLAELMTARGRAVTEDRQLPALLTGLATRVLR
jgi:uncharacterized protein (TIGR02679 family)